MEASGRLRKKIEDKFRDDIKRLSLLWPSENVYIEEIAQGKTKIQLHSGDYHEFDSVEVSRLLSSVPKYFWKIMKLPIVLRYEKHESGYSRCVVEGDVWQRRLVELLITGSVSSEGIKEVSLSQLRFLLSNYGSMVFVRVTI
ncbi:MAG: DUF61 family protein [Desulfurococcales archaeon]|nr:DUF61 family protein [Desulfurococcales archaeon]